MCMLPENGEKVAASNRVPLLLLPLLVGVVQVVCYYIAALIASPDGAMPIPQPDTLLYSQAARRIVEGAPFSFSPGSAPSTGTTSVLYPFVLAIPYALGFTGDSFLAAGFWLNAIFYLVFLFGWSVAISNWVADGRARNLAFVLLSLTGQPAYAALAQSDTGLWMAISAMMLASLSAGWFWPFAVLLVISPWVRPEGVFCGMAFFAVAMFARRGDRSKRELILAVPFVLSVIGVFALNYLLTGQAQFESVANKGFFKQQVFSAAVGSTMTECVVMFREVVLSLALEIPRSLYAIPVLGGGLILLGVYAHDWNRSNAWRQVAWLCAFVLSFLSVAQSQWQGTNMDRYLAWMMPMLTVFMAEGAVCVSSRLKDNHLLRMIPSAVVLYALGASFVYVCIFHSVSSLTDRRRAFVKMCDSVMEDGARIGSFNEGGLVYFMDNRSIANLSGVYSPEFKYMSVAERMEDLKRNSDKRFDYWMLIEELSALRDGDFSEQTFGPCVLAGPGSFALHKATWSAFDAGNVAPLAKEGETLVSRLDVGYPPDEKAAKYEVIDRYSRPAAQPFFLCAKDTQGRVIIDAGRVIVGGDSFDVRLVPGCDARVVMRSISTASATIHGELIRTQTVRGKIPETFSMNVAVDGQIIEKVTLKCDQKWFSEAEFTIPGSAITKEVSRISLLGDHIPCGYWFYQKK